MLEVAGFVLAGGRSFRMGRDKARLELGGETLIARAVRTLGMVCADVAIAGGDERLTGSGRVITDAMAGCGPLGGITAALEQSDYEWNLFLAVDMPFVPVEVLQGLVNAADRDCVGVMAEGGGQVQPLCAVYSRRAVVRLREELAAGRWKVRPAIEAAGKVKYLQLFVESWFWNVNTPEDFARLSGE